MLVTVSIRRAESEPVLLVTIVRTFGAHVWKPTGNEIAFSVGMLIGGPLADRFTVHSVRVASGVAMLVVVVTAVALPSGRRARRRTSALLARHRKPAPRADLGLTCAAGLK